MAWQTQILDEIEELDKRELPHGVYGIREAHAIAGRLPTLAYLFTAPGTTNFCQTVDVQKGRPRDRFADYISINASGEERVTLQILDFATTKVRQFGDVYRLDEHDKKPATEPDWDLESLVPKVRQRGKSIHSLLLVAHYSTSKEISGILGRSVDPQFLGRYRIAHSKREWSDRFGRGFTTALHFWAPQK
jgi:hypothetical protein